MLNAKVLIVGAGPVGLTLALDLAWRGIDVTVAEIRHAGEAPSVKCNQLAARSMEVFRRLGLAGEIRNLGLPEDYPQDVVSCTTVTGIELSRVLIPSRAGRLRGDAGPDTLWPTPEPPHRINQTYLEPLLFARAAAHPRIHMLNRTEVESYSQDIAGVTAIARNLDSGETLTIRCSYLAGCDGAKSVVRKTMGASYQGTLELQLVQSTCFRAPDLVRRLPGKPAWLYFALNPRRCGSLISIDGCETWILHNWLYRGEDGFETVDRDWAIRTILGVDADFQYEVLSKEDWVGRRLVADQFHDRRVFICGDAAHLWIPTGGYGMNAGIADAANLAWQLAAALKGWAAPEIVKAYQAERRPITEQASRIIMDISLRVMQQRRDITADVELAGAEGEATRARLGREAYALDIQQQCCSGLNFGYFYDASPVIAYDDEQPPAYTMGGFTSSTVPGCRAPHFWLDDGRSLYDALGVDFSLLRFDSNVQVDALVEAAARRNVPLVVIDAKATSRGAAYRHKLVLVRPDQHVAWRGDSLPENTLDLIDHVRGAKAE